MPRNPFATAEAALRRHALTYPEAYEEFPWGDRALKVKGKIFAIFGRKDGVLSMTVKLPVSGATALGLPFASPTGYGLGKSGWVTTQFHGDDDVPVEMLKEWIDESYRSIAPKKLVALLEDEGVADKKAAPRSVRKRKTRAKK